LARLVFEPFGGNTSWETQPQQAAWTFAVGALGLEFGRVLELRGHYWQGLEEAVEGQTPLKSYGGELRTYLPSLWRFQPQVLLGGSKLSGTAIPDRLIVPSAGAGMGFRVTNGVNLQFAARDYFPRKPDAPESAGWATLERSQQWMFSGGLSYALGRQPTWRDPAPPRAQVEHHAVYGPQILAVVNEWAAALQGGESSRPSGLYTVTALLIEPRQGVHRGGQAVQQYWTAQAPGGLTVQPLETGISGRVAFVTSNLAFGGTAAEGPTSGRLVTVLEEIRGRWMIRAQTFAPSD
jgi:ketosteroid isomerase-like protein